MPLATKRSGASLHAAPSGADHAAAPYRRTCRNAKDPASFAAAFNGLVLSQRRRKWAASKEKRPWRPRPSTIAPASSGITASSCRGRRRGSTSSPTASTTAARVFEGQRAYGGVVFKLDEHTRRLHNSAKILGFEIPYSVEAINRASQELLRAPGPRGRLCAADRLARQRDDGRLGAADAGSMWRSRSGSGRPISSPRSG